MDGGRERQLHESFGTCFYELHGRGGGLELARNDQLGKVQPSWGLQQHVREALVSGSLEC